MAAHIGKKGLKSAVVAIDYNLRIAFDLPDGN